MSDPFRYRPVYSSDPRDRINCKKCGRLQDECRCVKEASPASWAQIKPKVQLEKSGRGGKVVTVIRNLPKNSAFLEALAKELKQKCGCGGTFKLLDDQGIVELQGDKRDAATALLNQKKESAKTGKT